MKYKEIKDTNQEQLEEKFPWLKTANFQNAVVEINYSDTLVWKNGTWKSGLWKGGTWEDGVWEGGTWEGGTWEDGTWEDGFWEDGFWEDGVKLNKFKLKDLNSQQSILNLNLINKIKNPILYEIAFEFLKIKKTSLTIKEIKKLNNQKLLQLFSKKEGQELVKKHNNIISIDDIKELDKELINNQNPSINNVYKNISIGFTIWNGVQRYLKKETNHVFQINYKGDISKFPNLLSLQNYIKGSNHPTHKNLLTLSWVRFTILKDEPGALLIDEIQTDLDDEKFLGKEIMNNWEVKTLNLFIKFARSSLKKNKIYYPTYEANQISLVLKNQKQEPIS